MGDREVDWQQFGTEMYLEANYRTLLAADAQLCAELGRRYGELARAGRRRLRVLDVGTGPNLYPLIAALPVAGVIDAGDLCDANNAYLLEQCRRPSAHWSLFVEALAAGDPLYADLPWADLLASRVRPCAVDIHDLPEERWDVVSSFFVAESITDERGEYSPVASGAGFADAVTSLVRAVVPGGLVIVAFMAHSQGYDTAGPSFPAVDIDAHDVRAAMTAAGANVEVVTIGTPVRDGHDGMLLAVARRPLERPLPRTERAATSLEVLHVHPRWAASGVVDEELASLRDLVHPALLADATVLVMVDDYSLRSRPERVTKQARAAADAIVARAAAAGVWVDALVYESQLTGAAGELLAMLPERLRDEGVLRVDASGKDDAMVVRLFDRREDGSVQYSCPMMAAAWQLCRLGVCRMPETVPFSDAPVLASRTVTVLGGHYIHVESSVAAILAAIEPAELAASVRSRLGWVPLPDGDGERAEAVVEDLVPSEGDMWAGFDVELYTSVNYGEVLAVDAHLAERHRRWWEGCRGGDFVDVGAGSCLYPSMAAHRADSIIAWEYSEVFCAHLREQYAAPDARWDRYAALVGAGGNWREDLARTAKVVHAGVMDLPEAAFDRVSMHFVAECVDGTWAGFATSIASAVRALRPGGELLVAVMERSEDATYGEDTVPVCSVDATNLTAALRIAGAVDVSIEVLGGDEGRVRDGHRGVMCATARRSAGPTTVTGGGGAGR